MFNVPIRYKEDARKQNVYYSKVLNGEQPVVGNRFSTTYAWSRSNTIRKIGVIFLVICFLLYILWGTFTTNVSDHSVNTPSGLPFTHLASPMPEFYRRKKPLPRGVANRRAAIHWLRQRSITNGILYFGDDDNTYDLKLFSEIRSTQRVSMFPVGLIEEYSVSGPVVRSGKVVGFLDSWVAERRWPVDMAGFATNLAYMAEHPNASMPYKPGYEEDLFLRSIRLELSVIEPKARNCTEILVWHTQTKSRERSTLRINSKYLDNRSNLGSLMKSLEVMGVANVSDNEGQNAVISRNGKTKPISYFLS
ncbi:galactosylgalactosylxylosylprotein 3-beta-glucuronosyltransferase S isoform X3 [Anastrepha ludens]|uniref:galactosylgalactosylxylosylprotein 3-beta-glucuronosyltransferase S isoform X3 n=1 Tax=Anastrepha ludens TaxID=28586 RepID=UPI0023AEBEC0|nr:galactosylgalactosylxylosylprotein 3-beta-glucuronosyltransferase S isoform X3 [Anastrepha ludens]